MNLKWVLFVTYGVQHIAHKSAYGIFKSYEDAELFAMQCFDEGQFIAEIIPLNTELPDSISPEDLDSNDTEKVVSIKKNQKIEIDFYPEIDMT